MDDETQKRILELLEAREARRARARRAWSTWWFPALAVLVIGGIGGAYWWDYVQEQQAQKEQVCEMFSETIGRSSDEC